MQIRCPNCSAKLKLGEPKPGRYQPKCNQCEKRFLIEVSAQNPPKVRTGKLPETKTSRGDDQSIERKNADDASQTRAAVDATTDETAAANDRRGLPPVRSGSKRDEAPDEDHSGRAIQNDADDGLAAPPSRLGGYRIVRMLGRGAMGAVYQAKQISLDRDVAMKTIRGRLAENPASLARFTREAYAAAQLSHHNVVQIYDFGEDEGQHYFSMQWIRGGSLGDLVREKGCLDPKLAATYILQAARGLQFAHRNGMVHRDIKPANLLLTDDGVVKVADLGLVKVPDQLDAESSVSGMIDSEASADSLQYGLVSGTQVTMQGTAVGTPAYMAPEQSADATKVDHRADIYSLGCTLFFLLAGHAPYSSTEVSEILEQHAKAAVPDLSEINGRVPESLIAVVNRAMAKRPSDRYDSLAEMIDDLQSFLGVLPTIGFSPTAQQADRWESIATDFAKTQLVVRRSGSLGLAFSLVCLVITLLTTLASPSMCLLGPALLITAVLSAIGFAATSGENAIATYCRRWMGTLSWFEWSIAVSIAVLLSIVLLLTGLWIGVLVGVALGIVVGAVYHFSINRTARVAATQPLADARRFVRDLRIQGVDESGLRDFVARYSAGKGGDQWQSIYESLFGYDALVEARERLAIDTSFTAATDSSSIRGRVCKSLRAKTRAKQKARDQRKLAALEQQSLLSQGVDAAEARARSWQMASAIMETARSVVDQTGQNEKVIAAAKRERIKAMLADARSGKYRRPHERFSHLQFAFSGYIRMLVGCLLLTRFSILLKRSGILTNEVVAELQGGSVDLESFAGAADIWPWGVAGLLL